MQRAIDGCHLLEGALISAVEVVKFLGVPHGLGRRFLFADVLLVIGWWDEAVRRSAVDHDLPENLRLHFLLLLLRQACRQTANDGQRKQNRSAQTAHCHPAQTTVGTA